MERAATEANCGEKNRNEARTTNEIVRSIVV
jgi:hypothetical protein